MSLVVYVLLALVTVAAPYEAGSKRLFLLNGKQQVWMTEKEAFQQRLENPNFKFIDVTNGNLQWIENNKLTSLAAGVFPTNMTQQTLVNSMGSKIDSDFVTTFLNDFTKFNNRFFQSPTGLESAEFLFNQLESIRTSITRNDVTMTVRKIEHSEFDQFSIVARLEAAGATLPADGAVVLGSHQDSINLQNPVNGRAPGVDDDATGVVTNLEVLNRMLAETNFKPFRPIEFHFYAAEEGGLLGSQGVVREYLASNIPVYAMLQTDMTGFRPGSKILGIVTDNVDSALTATLRLVSAEYTDFQLQDFACGFACSDHASWTAGGIPAAIHIESAIEDINPNIHTTGDTLSELDPGRINSFIKNAIGFAVELSLFESEGGCAQ